MECWLSSIKRDMCFQEVKVHVTMCEEVIL